MSVEFEICSIELYMRTYPTAEILTTNINELSKGHSLDMIMQEIPQAIKDAFLVTHGTGERYLWVDCLCMVQDDAKALQQGIRLCHICEAKREPGVFQVQLCGEEIDVRRHLLQCSEAHKAERSPSSVTGRCPLHLSPSTLNQMPQKLGV